MVLALTSYGNPQRNTSVTPAKSLSKENLKKSEGSEHPSYIESGPKPGGVRRKDLHGLARLLFLLLFSVAHPLSHPKEREHFFYFL